MLSCSLFLHAMGKEGWGDRGALALFKWLLRLTFHVESLINLPNEEQNALQALYELSHLTHIQALQTIQGEFPHFEIGKYHAETNSISIRITHSEQTWEEVSTYFTYDPKPDDEILYAQAHHNLEQHIFITYSPNLLKNKNDKFNPRNLSEAI